MLKTMGLDEMSTGLYSLSSPSYIDRPKKVSHETGMYEYVISEDDNPGKDFNWAMQQLLTIITGIRLFPDYRLLVKTHLFGLGDNLSKTPRFAALLIDLDKKTVVQYMFTRRNLETYNITYKNILDLPAILTDSIGWKHDRL